MMDFVNELNHFTMYREKNDSFNSGYLYKYALPFEGVPQHVELTLWFQDHWYHSITISVVYYIVVRIIQRCMEKRAPYRLDRALFYWNCSHALYSIVAFLRMSEDFAHSASQSFYDLVCRSVVPYDVAAFWSVTFGMSKVAEFGDTLFIVLRKRPLIFLHYYHHAAVLVYAIHSGSGHNATGRVFMMMNLFAHALMYTYFAVKAKQVNVPRWVAMAVTTVQTIQMLAGVAVSIFVWWAMRARAWKCQQSTANLYLAFFLYATFAVLFVQFFCRTYLKPREKETKKMD